MVGRVDAHDPAGHPRGRAGHHGAPGRVRAPSHGDGGPYDQSQREQRAEALHGHRNRRRHERDQGEPDQLWPDAERSGGSAVERGGGERAVEREEGQSAEPRERLVFGVIVRSSLPDAKPSFNF